MCQTTKKVKVLVSKSPSNARLLGYLNACANPLHPNNQMGTLCMPMAFSIPSAVASVALASVAELDIGGVFAWRVPSALPGKYEYF